MTKHSEKDIVVKPVPTFELPIAKSYLYKHYDWGESITIDYFDWKDRLTQTNLFLENIISPNLFIVKTDAIFCNNFELNKCNASYKNKIFYTDTDRLTLDGVIKNNLIKILIKKIVTPFKNITIKL